MSAWSCENASFQLRSSSYRVLNFSSTFFDPHVICLLLLALYENKICMQEFLYNFIRSLLFREGFKKKWFYHFGVWLPPLESDKNIFYFFWILDHFLSTLWKKCIFAPRKAENTFFEAFPYREELKNRLAYINLIRDYGVPYEWSEVIQY